MPERLHCYAPPKQMQQGQSVCAY
uniref:Uncharacterized protein n=1 Tax=Anguilla anguilla TaxID=7936 RepID=A0A0E9SQG4_ANGAN